MHHRAQNYIYQVYWKNSSATTYNLRTGLKFATQKAKGQSVRSWE